MGATILQGILDASRADPFYQENCKLANFHLRSTPLYTYRKQQKLGSLHRKGKFYSRHQKAIISFINTPYFGETDLLLWFSSTNHPHRGVFIGDTLLLVQLSHWWLSFDADGAALCRLSGFFQRYKHINGTCTTSWQPASQHASSHDPLWLHLPCTAAYCSYPPFVSNSWIESMLRVWYCPCWYLPYLWQRLSDEILLRCHWRKRSVHTYLGKRFVKQLRKNETA